MLRANPALGVCHVTPHPALLVAARPECHVMLTRHRLEGLTPLGSARRATARARARSPHFRSSGNGKSEMTSKQLEGPLPTKRGPLRNYTRGVGAVPVLPTWYTRGGRLSLCCFDAVQCLDDVLFWPYTVFVVYCFLAYCFCRVLFSCILFCRVLFCRFPLLHW